MSQNTMIPSNSHTFSVKTDIHGLPASYVLAKNPRDPTGQTGIIVKVLDVPNIPSHSRSDDDRHPDPDIQNALESDNNCEELSSNQIKIPHSYMMHDFSETPLHLCDPTKLVTQHRRGDITLPRRTIDISQRMYTENEMKWYADPESKIPEPFHLVFVPKLKCYLCGDFQKSDDDIHYEGVGQHAFGYRYCTECKPYFLGSLYNAIAPIIKFRQNYEEWISSRDTTYSESRPFIWVARTRRDENGNRIVGGNAPYKYTKWTVLCWIAQKINLPRVCPEDGKTIIRVDEDSLLCEQNEGKEVVGFDYTSITKSVPLRDIYITNIGLLGENPNPEYDPNIDDPLNKYSEKEQCEMFERASKGLKVM
jgi:hypothetical protein